MLLLFAAFGAVSVIGEAAVHEVNWNGSKSAFDKQMTVKTGDQIVFSFPSWHNVWLLDDCSDTAHTGAMSYYSYGRGFNCNGSGTEKADIYSSPYAHVVTAAAGERLCFYCQRGSHCKSGWRVVVDVEAAEPTLGEVGDDCLGVISGGYKYPDCKEGLECHFPEGLVGASGTCGEPLGDIGADCGGVISGGFKHPMCKEGLKCQYPEGLMGASGTCAEIDLCEGKKCGDVCDNKQGMLMVMRHCQSDGSCAAAIPDDCPAEPVDGVHQVSWEGTPEDYEKQITVNPGDKIVFSYRDNHNVWMMDECPESASATSFNCDGTGKEVADDQASPYTHDVVAKAGEKLCFYCGKEGHCSGGWWLVADVVAPPKQHVVSWENTASDYDKLITVNPGDQIVFKYKDNHNVWMMDECPASASATSFDCSGTGKEMADDQASPYTHDVVAAAGDKLCFYCGKEYHCDGGWWLVVDVEAPSAPKPKECNAMDQTECDAAILAGKCIKHNMLGQPCQTLPTKEDCAQIKRNKQGCRDRGCHAKNKNVCELKVTKPTPAKPVVAEGNTDCSTLPSSTCKTAKQTMKVDCAWKKVGKKKTCTGTGASIGGGADSAEDPCSKNKAKKSKCKGNCEIKGKQCVTKAASNGGDNGTVVDGDKCAKVNKPSKKTCKKAKCKFAKAKGGKPAACK